MKKLIIVVLLLIGCKEFEGVKIEKIVVNKLTDSSGDARVAFTDGYSCYVDFGLASQINKGDTLVFNQVEGLSFSKWNSNFVKIKKLEKE